MSSFTYVFEKTDSIKYDYAIDCKTLLNKRRKLRKESSVSDLKDTMGLNNDWLSISLKEATQKEYSFVCAFENRTIVYKRNTNSAKENLTLSKHEKGIRFISLFGYIGVILIISGIIGGICGGFISYFTH